MANTVPITVVWVLIGAISLWYLIKNYARSLRTRDRARERVSDERIGSRSALFLAEKRCEEERCLIYVEIVLDLAGAVSLLADPIMPSVITATKAVLPLILLAAKVLLAYHSFLIHRHYHALMNIYAAESLQSQLLERRLVHSENLRQAGVDTAQRDQNPGAGPGQTVVAQQGTLVQFDRGLAGNRGPDPEAQ